MDHRVRASLLKCLELADSAVKSVNWDSPASERHERSVELDPNQQYYLQCKASVRSLKALNFLRQQGFKYLKSVKGGITAWSEEIDSRVPRY